MLTSHMRVLPDVKMIMNSLQVPDEFTCIVPSV